MRTQVGIVGGGPSGLLLAQILAQAGIESVVLERRARSHVLSRVRAGILERGTVALLHRAGVGARLAAEGVAHGGTALAFGGALHRIDLAGLTGHRVTLYGQTELTRDLYAASDARGGTVIDRAEAVTIHGADTDAPTITWTRAGAPGRLACDFVVGCDGFHGVARRTIPQGVLREIARVYPFGWLGILAETRPAHEELIYANHPEGFALCSMRGPRRSRHYVQVPQAERVEDWSDDRFWEALTRRLPPEIAETLETGPSVEKSIAPLRSFVAEPMRWGRLFLAGDAAHIVPPTGAKGLNLAAADIHYLSDALIAFYRTGEEAGLADYSDRALARVWKVERFSWWLTSLLHDFPENGAFGARMQRAELDYLVSSSAAMTVFAENYVGLPL